MSVTIGELQGIISLQDNFSAGIEAAAKKVSSMGESFAALTGFAGMAAGAVTAVAGSIVALGIHGADVNDVQEAFAGLAKGAGSAADVMLGALRSGTAGALSDFDLMKEANKALGGGFITNAKDMETLANGARELGKATGVDTKTAFESLEKAMATGKTTGLGFKGLMVDTTGATKAYEDATGKSAAELTKHERATIGAHAVLDALNKRFTDRAPADFGEMVAQAKVGVQNFTDKLGVAISQSPVIQAGMQAMGQALGAAFGGSQANLITTLMEYVNRFAIGLTYVAQGALLFGQVGIQAFYGVQTVIAGLMTALAAAGKTIVGVVDGLASMMEKIPGHAKWIDTFAQSTKGASLYMTALTKSLGEETDQAAKGAMGHSAASQVLDKMGGVVMTLRDKMEEAGKAHVKLNENVKAVKPAFDEAKDAASKYAEKMAGVIQKLEDELSLVGLIGRDKRLAQAKLGYDKEIEELRKTGKTSGELYDEAFAKITLKYQQEVAVIKLSSDEIATARKTLVDKITLGAMTGTQLRLAQLEIEKAKEIEAAAVLTIRYSDEYNTRIALINRHYEQASAAAQGHYATVEQYAAAGGFKSREELQNSATNAAECYDRMLRSGKYTFHELEKAHAASIKAQDDLNGTHTKSTMEQYEIISKGASSILRSLFGKSKTAAYAAAVIDTAAAVVSTFRNSGGWPWGLIPAAAMLAAGVAQIQKISSTNASFAQGTPNIEYQQFGSGVQATLHGEEAVVTRGQGATLGDDIASRVEGMLGGRGGRPQIIQLIVSGRKLAEALVPEIPRVLAAHGVGTV